MQPSQKLRIIFDLLPKPHIAQIGYADFNSFENWISPFGVTLPAAFEEWFSAMQALGTVSLADAVRFYKRNHDGVTKITLSDVLPLFHAAKQVAKVSSISNRVSRC